MRIRKKSEAEKGPITLVDCGHLCSHEKILLKIWAWKVFLLMACTDSVAADWELEKRQCVLQSGKELD